MVKVYFSGERMLSRMVVGMISYLLLLIRQVIIMKSSYLLNEVYYFNCILLCFIILSFILMIYSIYKAYRKEYYFEITNMEIKYSFLFRKKTVVLEEVNRVTMYFKDTMSNEKNLNKLVYYINSKKKVIRVKEFLISYNDIIVRSSISDKFIFNVYDYKEKKYIES
ncbi:MAG: hypothetical protein KQ78_01595 [Candidatus Izimaplasma bacterium HR2]|nr:MAG: hypothetical protein KQ78_01595 [Candidatus Izimaplasma bacterium HR2]